MSERSTHLLLGELKGQLTAILDRMDRADESRAGVHRRLDDFVQRITRVEADLVLVIGSQATMQTVTDDVVPLRTQAQGWHRWAGTAQRRDCHRWRGWVAAWPLHVVHWPAAALIIFPTPNNRPAAERWRSFFCFWEPDGSNDVGSRGGNPIAP
ncbi:DUF1515 family protein [Aminobacter sp. AP02]|uniref:DUF1515 family protein n=1 Tax=Aminobacter sp. AP02 TaxID=2135737 RepID=UPI001FDF3DCB|nr:DUF1515 family protein [Aminobacter sp. AP02]